jgi:hypothetical protein
MSISNIETTRTNDVLTISIALKGLKTEEVDDFLALIKSGLLVQKSKMSEADADKISEEIKASWWEKNKARIEKMIDEND